MRTVIAAYLLGGLLLVSLAFPVRADSEMHQSPLLERGSPEACDAVRSGRQQRGGYSWRFSCSDTDSDEGRGRSRGR
jgi:hypothetical protein